MVLITPYYTRKNDHMRCISHREAVFGTVIHNIFDAWHYACHMDIHVDEITMIQMRFCALDTIHPAAYNKFGSKLPDPLRCMLPSTLLLALDCTLPAYLTVCSQVHSWACFQGHFQLHSILHSQPA